jgi:hypothetical protein
MFVRSGGKGADDAVLAQEDLPPSVRQQLTSVVAVRALCVCVCMYVCVNMLL